MQMARFSNILSAFRLPAFLTALFILQNQIFNILVGLSYNPHLPFFVIISFSLGMLLYAPSVFFGKVGRYAYLFVAATAVSLIFISQYLYFSFFGGFLQASALKYAGQIGEIKSTIAALFTPHIFVFLLNVFTVIAAGALSYKEKITDIFLSKKEKTIASLGIFAIVIFGYTLSIAAGENGLKKLRHLPQTIREMNSFVYSPNDYVQRVGICNYYLGDLIGMAFRAVPVTEEDVVFVQNWFSQKPAPEEERYFGAAEGKNLILIQFESLETALIGQKIKGTEITPNINALSKQGLYFNNYYTQIGPGNTADTEFVVLNSLYPLTNTVAFVDFAHNEYDALPSLLQKSGYHTYTLHGGVPNFWNRANIYPSLGYETSISKNDFAPENKGFETLNDADFFSQSLVKMQTFEKPFLATLITLSSHSPFVIPEKYQTLPIPENSPLSPEQKNYLQSIHYADSALGEFIAGLKKTSLYRDSLIAIYGDHGSPVKISEQIGTTTNSSLPTLRSSRVPLIILYPKAAPPLIKTVKTPGSHLDLYPTLANLLGVVPPKNIFGQDLLVAKTPIVTRRDPYSKIITTILTPSLAYEYSGNGSFENGKCLKMPDKKEISLSECKKLYDEQLANIKASDLIIKGDLLPKLIPTATSTETP